MFRLSLALKAGFHPDQPRVPQGRPDGGQWIRVPGYAQVHRVSRRRASGGQIRIGGRSHPITPAQEAQLAQSYGAMRSALREVRELDPAWRPPAQAYSSVEGLISANRAIELEARFRIFQLLGTRAEMGFHAREWIPAPPTNRRLHRSEQRELDTIGGNGVAVAAAARILEQKAALSSATIRCQSRWERRRGSIPIAPDAAPAKAAS